MRREQRLKLAITMGRAFVRALETRKKRVERIRSRLRSGAARDCSEGSGPMDIVVDNVLHRADCICYDCLYGELRYIRRLAQAPEGTSSDEFDALEAMPREYRSAPRGGRR